MHFTHNGDGHGLWHSLDQNGIRDKITKPISPLSLDTLLSAVLAVDSGDKMYG